MDHLGHRSPGLRCSRRSVGCTVHLATSVVAYLYTESDREDERSRIGGVVRVPFVEPELVDCTVFQARPWSATGGSIQLGAGPVTATADTAKVSGTSRCCVDPPGVLTTSGGGGISANYLPGGGRQPSGSPKCKSGYEDWYEGTGTVDAKAAHGAGCFADGAQDSATGARTKITFGNITLLDATLANAQNDMTKRAESNVTLTSKACVQRNTFSADEAYTVERTATGRSEIE